MKTPAARPAKIALLLLLSPVGLVPAVAQGWNQRFPATLPPAANSGRMIYDSARGVCVLFGGSGSLANDLTWEYDGLDWKQVNTANRPSTRYAHAMAYDLLRRVTVLFGGETSSGSSNETWEYDGIDWKLVTTTSPPSARNSPEMVYDVATRRIVLYGGAAGNTMFRETWEYDAATTTWTLITGAGTPDQSIQFAMTYDPFRSKTIIFGGVNASFTLFNSLWEYDGGTKTWSQPTITSPMPSARRLIRGELDIARRVMVAHGGDRLRMGGEQSDTWEYDLATQTWTDRTVTGTGPALNREYALAYDVRRQTVVLWGGITNNTYTNWTWEYGLRGRFTPFGNGCRGSSAIGIPTLTATSPGPIIGRTMSTRAAPAPNGGIMLVGFSNTRHESGLPLPFDLSGIGALGCTLYVSTHLIVPVAATGGVIDFQLPIPLDPALSGLSYYQQALVQDLGINPLQHVLTNAATATIL